MYCVYLLAVNNINIINVAVFYIYRNKAIYKAKKNSKKWVQSVY